MLARALRLKENRHFQSVYRRHFMSVDYVHDFARWALISLNLPPLAERLAQTIALPELLAEADAGAPLHCQLAAFCREALLSLSSPKRRRSSFLGKA